MKITPLKAVRKHCLHCVGYSPEEVKDCGSTKKDCVLFPYRFGHNPKNNNNLSVKIIKKYCMWCMNYPSYQLSECLSPNCNLFQFRFGKNPARAGIGNINAFKRTVSR